MSNEGKASATTAIPEQPAVGKVRVERPVRAPGLWWSVLPYAPIPALGLLLVYTRYVDHARNDGRLELGVYIAVGVSIGLVLLRQALATRENRRLYARLHDAYRELEACTEETVRDARAMAQLNAQLRAMHAELAENNRALAAANRRLEELATTDPLTGLPNHRALVAVLDGELERMRRYDRPCTVLFLDLDYFKALNDSHGHPAGDTALAEFGAVVRAALRAVDTVGRWGGEEFLAILPETDRESGLTAAEHVRAAVAAHRFTAGEGLHLTCSIGVATYPEDAAERDNLVAQADQALYAAKRLGRNQVRAAADAVVAALAGEAGRGGLPEEVALTGTVEALAALVEARDQYAGRRLHEVAGLAVRLALSMGRTAGEARLIGLAGRLRDVGKVAIPDAVLQKPSPLSPKEWTVVRSHSLVGADVVGRALALRAIAPLIRAHHERWDGHGYPDGLAGTAIPLGARIVAVADAYGAMTTPRAYRDACAPAQALAELRRCAGTQFDPDVVAALERILTADPLSSELLVMSYELEASSNSQLATHNSQLITRNS